MLEKIQSKSKKERKKIVIFFSVFITLLVIVFWAISLPSKLSVETEEEKKTPSPTKTFLNIIKTSFTEVIDRF